MKYIKKTISVLLITLMLVLNFGFVLNVNAIDPTTDTGTITVTNVNAGDTLAAYKILDTIYNGDNTISYSFNTEFATFLASTSGATRDYSSLTTKDFENNFTNANTTIEQLASDYAIYIKNLQSAPRNVSNLTTTGTTAVSGNLAPGSYLILPTSATKIYSVMVANIEYVAGDNNAWVLKDGGNGAGNVTVTAKAVSPAITASFRESTELLETSYNLTDTISVYAHAQFPPYPTHASNELYSISVDFSNGAYQNAEISELIINKGTTYEKVATLDNGNIKIDENVVGTYTSSNGVITFMNSGINSHMVTFDATFTAKFTNDVPAGVNQPITASLGFTTEPYGTGSTSSDVTLNAKTYGLNVYLKEANNETDIPLTGATYNVCSDQNCNNVITSITTDGGKATLFGVKAGLYYVQESRAVAGYTLDNDIKSITVGDSEFEDPLENGYYKVSLTNVKAAGLPFTGGVGTIIYTMIGLLIIAVAVLVITSSKNKNKIETM